MLKVALLPFTGASHRGTTTPAHRLGALPTQSGTRPVLRTDAVTMIPIHKSHRGHG